MRRLANSVLIILNLFTPSVICQSHDAVNKSGECITHGECYTGFRNIPEGYQAVRQSCMIEYSTSNCTCRRLCTWKGMGYITAEGKWDESRVSKVSHAVYSPESAIARTNDMTRCYDEYDLSLNEPDINEDGCSKVQPLIDCFNKNMDNTCKQQSKDMTADGCIPHKECFDGARRPPRFLIIQQNLCREKFRHIAGTNTACSTCVHLCMWQSLGYISKHGHLDETGISDMSHALYNNEESARARSADIISCYKKHYLNFTAPDIMANNCIKAKPLLECVKRQLQMSCSKEPNKTPDCSVKECFHGFKSVPEDQLIQTSYCTQKYLKSSNNSCACVNLCIYKNLGYFDNIGSLNESRILESSSLQFSSPSAKLRMDDFITCYKENPVNVDEQDVMDNNCAKASSLMECLKDKLKNCTNHHTERYAKPPIYNGPRNPGHLSLT